MDSSLPTVCGIYCNLKWSHEHPHITKLCECLLCTVVNSTQVLLLFCLCSTVFRGFINDYASFAKDETHFMKHVKTKWSHWISHFYIRFLKFDYFVITQSRCPEYIRKYRCMFVHMKIWKQKQFSILASTHL